MKILHTVESYHPSIGGMQESVRRISEELATKGHQVTVATSRHPERTGDILNGVSIKSFAIAGNAVKGCTGETESYRRFLQESDFDIITNFAAQQWATDLAFPLIEHFRAGKVFVPVGFSRLSDGQFGDYFSAMPRRMRAYDMNVFLSDTYQDARFAREHGITNRMVIPNGASLEEFSRPPRGVRKRLGISERSFLVLTVSSHIKSKGHREAIRVFAKARVRNSALLIVGNPTGGGCQDRCARMALLHSLSLPALLRRKVIRSVSLSREDTVSLFQESDLFLFPSTIECSPLVLFESVASRTPFLSSEAGNAAEIAGWTGGGMVIPFTTIRGRRKFDVDAGVRALEELYRDPELRSRMGQAGHEAWKSRFAWEKIAGEYEALYKSILTRKSAGNGAPRL